MEKDKILYVTIDEQIAKLKHQGLIINDPALAKAELELYGYSNLIKSYRDPYTFVSEGQKIYRSGITFEQVLSLYILDKNLRNIVQRTPVWITSKSNKYHMDQHCCGIKNPIELELSDAQKQGFRPCKKCCHEDM